MKSTTKVRAGWVGTLVLGVLAVALYAAETNPRRPVSQAFMRQKLIYSQGILEGLALEKFELVSDNALRMRDMIQSNLWFTMRQPDYLEHTTNFQKSIDVLYIAALDKKLEAASEAYINVARRCIECHRLVRTEQRKNAGQPTKPKLEPDFRPSGIP